MTGLLIYGANGYTGSLIAREAVRRGLAPVLAGRDARAVGRLAAELGGESRVASLEDNAALGRALAGMGVVLNCAGPFSATAAPMMRACLAGRAHYLDITGEIDVFEAAHALDAAAATAGIILCPGVGFDVVPTDCVAARLHAALPEATYLALGFDTRSPQSPGTARTTVEGLAKGGRIRSSGRLVGVAHAFRTRDVDFGAGRRPAATIPWGDVSSAFFTTGIPNIEVYVAMPPHQIAALRRLNRIAPVLRLGFVQAILKSGAARAAPGPDEAARRATPVRVWGEVQAPSGELRSARLTVANGYDVTVQAALAVAAHMLSYRGPGGYRTPSQLMGGGFIERLPGSSRIEIDAGRAWEPRPA